MPIRTITMMSPALLIALLATTQGNFQPAPYPAPERRAVARRERHHDPYKAAREQWKAERRRCQRNERICMIEHGNPSDLLPMPVAP
jgi:hypothetical protein